VAGLAAAWRLSESGWEAEFESITVYQRGWRLGGKGASSRGVNGRIEEHGLHVWFGWYENAFQLLRECYEVLDRTVDDPACPVRALHDAMVPSGTIGLAERQDGVLGHWAIEMPPNSRSSAGSVTAGRELTAVDFSMQALTLISHYFDALAGARGSTGSGGARALAAGLAVSSTALIAELARLADSQKSLHHTVLSGAGPGIGAVGALLGAPQQGELALLRTWEGIALMMAAVRGIVADGLLTDPHGFETVNNEEYLDWIERHGGPSELRDFSVVRGLYDLAFGYVDGDRTRPSISAGTGVLFGGKSLLDYKDSFVWKMRAGMGDIVFAPLYQALRRRGVEFEFFHRVDQLHPSADGNRIDAITVGRQVRLTPGTSRYEPLVSCRGLPVFPSRPLVDQLSDAEGVEMYPLESHWCEWRDAEKRVLQRGVEFDLAVFAIPPGMAKFVCSELIARRPEWRDMVNGIGTVATQSLQLWMRGSEGSLNWPHPGSTMTGIDAPFGTWASMSHVLDAEEWPVEDQPGSVAYFCGVLDAPVVDDAASAAGWHARVRQHATDFMDGELAGFLPGAVGVDGFRWDLLCGSGDGDGPDLLDSQYWRANVDPSDRYVQSLPGTDRYRLRSDESGYDNLFLAGDWTDSGVNAGCIEAAVLSGLQAANAVRQRPRDHRIAGYFLP
jgi:uncharacterized protein with NAD-binding domain and iron-sulfur cluster